MILLPAPQTGARHHTLVIRLLLEQYRNTGRFDQRRAAMFFTFPEDARWNAETQAIEFGVGIGEYEGVVRVPRDVFRRFIDGAVTPDKCIEAYHLHRTRFEMVAERKLRQRQLTDDGNVANRVRC